MSNKKAEGNLKESWKTVLGNGKDYNESGQKLKNVVRKLKECCE